MGIYICNTEMYVTKLYTGDQILLHWIACKPNRTFMQLNAKKYLAKTKQRRQF